VIQKAESPAASEGAEEETVKVEGGAVSLRFADEKALRVPELRHEFELLARLKGLKEQKSHAADRSPAKQRTAREPKQQKTARDGRPARLPTPPPHKVYSTYRRMPSGPQSGRLPTQSLPSEHFPYQRVPLVALESLSARDLSSGAERVAPVAQTAHSALDAANSANALNRGNTVDILKVSPQPSAFAAFTEHSNSNGEATGLQRRLERERSDRSARGELTVDGLLEHRRARVALRAPRTEPAELPAEPPAEPHDRPTRANREHREKRAFRQGAAALWFAQK